MLPLIQRLMLPNVNGSTFVIIINPQKKKVISPSWDCSKAMMPLLEHSTN
jgi:hypothetical protein